MQLELISLEQNFLFQPFDRPYRMMVHCFKNATGTDFVICNVDLEECLECKAGINPLVRLFLPVYSFDLKEKIIINIGVAVFKQMQSIYKSDSKDPTHFVWKFTAGCPVKREHASQTIWLGLNSAQQEKLQHYCTPEKMLTKKMISSKPGLWNFAGGEKSDFGLTPEDMKLYGDCAWRVNEKM